MAERQFGARRRLLAEQRVRATGALECHREIRVGRTEHRRTPVEEIKDAGPVRVTPTRRRIAVSIVQYRCGSSPHAVDHGAVDSAVCIQLELLIGQR
jgi:hypothetical protein